MPPEVSLAFVPVEFTPGALPWLLLHGEWAPHDHAFVVLEVDEAHSWASRRVAVVRHVMGRGPLSALGRCVSER